MGVCATVSAALLFASEPSQSLAGICPSLLYPQPGPQKHLSPFSVPAAQGSQDSMKWGWCGPGQGARGQVLHSPSQGSQAGRELLPTPFLPMSLRNPEPQAEVCKVLPGVIAGYMEQSEELKTYFHCIIKTCKGREEEAQGSTWLWDGEHLALGHSSPCCIFWSREGTGPAVILQLGGADTQDRYHC